MSIQVIAAPDRPAAAVAVNRPGWAQAHRRYVLVHTVAEDVSREGAAAVDAHRADIDAEFGDLGGLLVDAQRRCYTAFDAQLDAVLDYLPADQAAAVGELAGTIAGSQPALHALLAAYADHPALQDIRAHHRLGLLGNLGVDVAALCPAPFAAGR